MSRNVVLKELQREFKELQSAREEIEAKRLSEECVKCAEKERTICFHMNEFRFNKIAQKFNHELEEAKKSIGKKDLPEPIELYNIPEELMPPEVKKALELVGIRI